MACCEFEWEFRSELVVRFGEIAAAAAVVPYIDGVCTGCFIDATDGEKDCVVRGKAVCEQCLAAAWALSVYGAEQGACFVIEIQGSVKAGCGKEIGLNLLLACRDGEFVVIDVVLVVNIRVGQ